MIKGPRFIIFISVSLYFFTFANRCEATKIQVPVNGTTSGFGSSEPYRGQIFSTPSLASFAQQLTVFIGGTSDRYARFRLLLTEVDMTNGFHPTNVLFESETQNVPIDLSREAKPFTFDLAGIPLKPGEKYAWILDYFANATPGAVVSISTGVDLSGSYAGGVPFCFFSGPLLPSGTRADHFASNNWMIDIYSQKNLAFTLEFSQAQTIPLNSGWNLISFGIAKCFYDREIPALSITDPKILLYR